MWIDELKTWQIAQWPLGDMLENRFGEGHLPLYFLGARWWISWFGAVDWVLRLPSVAFGVGSVFLLTLLGEEGFSRKTAFLGGALLAIHPLDLWASQIVRMYSMLTFLTIAASLVRLRLERSGKWRYCIALALIDLMGLTTQALYGFFILIRIPYLFWNHGRRFTSQWKILAATVCAMLAATPVWMLLGSQQHQIEMTGQGGQVNLDRMFRYAMNVVVGDYEMFNLKEMGIALGAVCSLWGRSL